MIELILQYDGLIALVILLADRIADMTKTKKDDKVIGVIHSILRLMGLRVRDKLTEDDKKE